MSGGSYEYVSFRFEEAAGELRSRHPDEPHVVALADHIDRLAKVMHDIEWADSSDTTWNAALDEAIRRLLEPGADLSIILAKARTLQVALTTALDS